MDKRPMKIQIDSGYITPDPADSHRSMAILYNAESDSVIILRRAETVENRNAADWHTSQTHGAEPEEEDSCSDPSLPS